MSTPISPPTAQVPSGGSPPGAAWDSDRAVQAPHDAPCAGHDPRRTLDRLVAADLPAATERVAWRLLALSGETMAGNLALTWDEYAALCGRANRVAARRHLTALAKAGFLQYSTSRDGGGTVWLHVTWVGMDCEGAVMQDTAQAKLGTSVSATPPESVDRDTKMVSARDYDGRHDTDSVSTRYQNGIQRDTEMVSGGEAGAAQDTKMVSPNGRSAAQDTKSVSAHSPRSAGRDTAPKGLPVSAGYQNGMQRDTEMVSDDTESRPKGSRPGYQNGIHRTAVPHTRDGGGGSIQPSHGGEITTTNHPPGIRTRLRTLGLKPEAVAIDATLSVHEVAAILDAWEQDMRRGEVGTGALIYRLKNGITPPDVSRLKRKDYKPAEFADVILG